MPSDFGRGPWRHRAPSCRSFAAAYWMDFTMFTYPVHRQRLPEIAQRISPSVGLGVFLRNA